MTHILSTHVVLVTLGRLFERAAAVVVGLAMMIVGLAMGVTMVLLPAGLVVGLLGVAIFVGGLFARIDGHAR